MTPDTKDIIIESLTRELRELRALRKARQPKAIFLPDSTLQITIPYPYLEPGRPANTLSNKMKQEGYTAIDTAMLHAKATGIGPDDDVIFNIGNLSVGLGITLQGEPDLDQVFVGLSRYEKKDPERIPANPSTKRSTKRKQKPGRLVTPDNQLERVRDRDRQRQTETDRDKVP